MEQEPLTDWVEPHHYMRPTVRPILKLVKVETEDWPPDNPPAESAAA